MPAGRHGGVAGIGVVFDEIRDPLPAVQVLKGRCIHGRDDLLGVALGAQKEDGLGDGAIPEGNEGTGGTCVPFWTRGIWPIVIDDGVLADQDWVLRGVVVEVRKLIRHLEGNGVLVEVTCGAEGWRDRANVEEGGDDGDVGVGSVNGIVKGLETVIRI